VHRPFVLVGVEYRWSRDAQGWRVGTDEWQMITNRSYIVPAGWYLVGEVGDYRAELVGVAGMDSDPEGCVFEWEGFGAFDCMAGCDSCDACWLAQGGSWHFRPDGCDGPEWDFDDADDFEGDTVGCPACGCGRVGFSIF
jgi:hypothetical protein